jgi:hypothetical protein
MVTAAAPQPASRTLPRGAYDRIFFGGMALAMALTVLAGFAPSYYLRFVLHGTSPTGTAVLSPLLHVHAAAFTAWVALFVVQTALVASHRVRLHRRLGVAGGVLAAVMVALGVAAALDAVRRGAAPAGLDPRVFLVVPLGNMATFGGFVVAALVLRRNKEAHKRLMVLAYLGLLVAAAARLPGVLPLGPAAPFVVAFLPFLGAGIVYDWTTRRKVHPVYLWGGALLVLSIPARLALAKTSAWLAFADLITR